MPFNFQYSIKLEKGDYVIRLHVRHEKKEYLDKLSDVPLLLQQKLSNAINLDVYNSYLQAIVAGKKANVSHGLHSTVMPFYIAPLPADKYAASRTASLVLTKISRFVAKSNNPAQLLTGYISYCKDDLGKKVDSHPFKYVLLEGSSKKSSNGTNNSSDKSKLDECKEAVRDLKTQFLGKMGKCAGGESFCRLTQVVDVANAEKLYEEYTGEFPDHLPLHTAFLQVLDPLDVKRALPNLASRSFQFTKDTQNKITSVCDKALESLNEESILAFTAMKADLRPDASKIKTSVFV
jgi:tripeptidyl-peptidase-2